MSVSLLPPLLLERTCLDTYSRRPTFSVKTEWSPRTLGYFSNVQTIGIAVFGFVRTMP